jgi:hypothetical protein
LLGEGQLSQIKVFSFPGICNYKKKAEKKVLLPELSLTLTLLLLLQPALGYIKERSHPTWG